MLSRAMAERQDVFPPVAVHLMAAGEASGSLPVVLGRLADYLEKTAELKGSAGVLREVSVISSSASTRGSTWPCGQTSGSDAAAPYSSRATSRTAGMGLK